MTSIPIAFWSQHHVESQLRNVLQSRLQSLDRTSFTARELAQATDVSVADIRALLDEMVCADYLRVVESRRCSRCRVELTEEDLAAQRCPCGTELSEESPQVERVYVRDGAVSRDVRWAVAIHGMNTPGAWQQDVSWRLAQMYGYSIPVAIYKYGLIILSPLVPFRQRIHRDRLLRYLRKVRDEMKGTPYGERPDVIAHSFGTWLLSEALRADTGPDRVKLGRIILTGSIVRPDFQWQRFLDEGRIEAVLCHCALRDLAVPMAQYFIPHSGPSGRCGFNDRRLVTHILAPTFGHSDYFTEANLSPVMRTVWAPFFRRALASADAIDSPGLPDPTWRPNPLRYVTRVLKVAVLIGLSACAVLAIAAALTGIGPLLEKLL